MAKWRPSGEGTAHGTAGPPKKGVLTGCTTPLDSQRTFELPFKSSCTRREPSLVRLETKSVLPSAAQSILCRLLRSFAVIVEEAPPSRRKRLMVFWERLSTAIDLPSAERSQTYSALEVGSMPYLASSRPRPFTGSKAVKTSWVRSAVFSAIAQRFAGDLAQRKAWKLPCCRVKTGSGLPPLIGVRINCPGAAGNSSLGGAR